MARRHRGGATDGEPPRGSLADPDGEVRQTLLFHQLFEGIDEESTITVLDVGGGVADTVRFFSGFRSRLHFADLIDAEALHTRPGEDVDAYYDAVFAELLSFPPDTCFDICLFWDFLNHLPVRALHAFSRALAPYVDRGTLGHGFGAFKAAPALARNTPEQALAYAVCGRDELIVRPRPGGAVPAFAHSRTVLADAFVCFEIVRGTLLQDGAMELFLKGTGRGAF